MQHAARGSGLGPLYNASDKNIHSQAAWFQLFYFLVTSRREHSAERNMPRVPIYSVPQRRREPAVSRRRIAAKAHMARPFAASLLATLLADVSCLALPRPQLQQVPLPLKLAGGLFLFRSSVAPENRALADEALAAAQAALNADPLVTSELGAGLEVGGVFASSACDGEEGRLFALNFQISGGNLWAEASATGIKRRRGSSKLDFGTPFELLDLTVSNMDAVLTGGEPSIRVALPSPKPPATIDI